MRPAPLALAAPFIKANFNPDEPRIPAGQPGAADAANADAVSATDAGILQPRLSREEAIGNRVDFMVRSQLRNVFNPSASPTDRGRTSQSTIATTKPQATTASIGYLTPGSAMSYLTGRCLRRRLAQRKSAASSVLTPSRARWSSFDRARWGRFPLTCFRDQKVIRFDLKGDS